MSWAKARPWLASFYFGAAVGIVFGAWVAVQNGTRAGILTSVLIWLICWPVMAVAMKRRWGLRPEGEAPEPSIRRPWSESSDRSLTLFMWFFGFGAVVLLTAPALGFADWSPFDLLSLGCAILLFLVAWAERRRRRNEH
jgi:hypothetical protein